MDTKTGFLNFRHMGISTKTSLISGIVVLLLLATTAMVILAMESRMIGYIIESLTQKETAALQARAEEEKKALAQRHQINTKICAGLSASFVYNFEQEGLKKSIKTFLSLPDLSAIVVTDAEGKPFSALWKEGGAISAADKLPGSVVLDENLSFENDIVQGTERIGSVRVFYTDKPGPARQARYLKTPHL